MRTKKIKLSDLMNETIENEINLIRTHLFIEILRFVTSQSSYLCNALIHYQKRNVEHWINYTRIYLCRNESKLCYVMMNHECNKQFFYRDQLLRNNGTITCGSHLRLLAPYPIEQMMEGNMLV